MTDPPTRHDAVRPEATLAIDWARTLTEQGRWLRTVILTRLGEPQAVDEVMQEVCLAAVRQQAPLTDATKVAPWLYRLALTQTLLYRRTHGRRRKLTARYAEAVRPSDQDGAVVDPLRWLMNEERRKHVRMALKHLPERDAEILVLKYTEHWSYHEIAARLGISHSAVETRLHRARAKLRNELIARQVNESEP